MVYNDFPYTQMCIVAYDSGLGPTEFHRLDALLVQRGSLLGDEEMDFAILGDESLAASCQ